ncbi:MAG: hypothetical protein HY340_02480 [Candidatus Kerfeldbacteria bacterium]|nr:hypothetical protein [Candidatus Kerfeldbacteria bacterium]
MNFFQVETLPARLHSSRIRALTVMVLDEKWFDPTREKLGFCSKFFYEGFQVIAQDFLERCDPFSVEKQ